MPDLRHGWRHLAIILICVPFLSVLSVGSIFGQSTQPDSTEEMKTISFEDQKLSPATAPSMWSLLKPRKSSATATFLGGGNGDEALNSYGLDLSTSFSAPCPWIDSSFMSVSPSFGFQSLDGPAGVDLPSTVYRGSLSFSLMKPINEKMQVMLGISPSFASDLEATSDAFRMMAFGTLMWQTSPEMKWVFGVAATGREDIPVLPMAGFIWTPNKDWKIEVTAPRPRIAYLLGDFEGSSNNWLYLAGEFGGGTWAVDRNGQDDILNIRDFRLIAGWEQLDEKGFNPRLEAGYVFGRQIEYESDSFEFEPSDALMIRAGFAF